MNMKGQEMLNRLSPAFSAVKRVAFKYPLRNVITITAPADRNIREGFVKAHTANHIEKLVSKTNICWFESS